MLNLFMVEFAMVSCSLKTTYMKESKCDFHATSTSTYFGICHHVIEKKKYKHNLCKRTKFYFH